MFHLYQSRKSLANLTARLRNLQLHALWCACCICAPETQYQCAQALQDTAPGEQQPCPGEGTWCRHMFPSPLRGFSHHAVHWITFFGNSEFSQMYTTTNTGDTVSPADRHTLDHYKLDCQKRPRETCGNTYVRRPFSQTSSSLIQRSSASIDASLALSRDASRSPTLNSPGAPWAESATRAACALRPDSLMLRR